MTNYYQVPVTTVNGVYSYGVDPATFTDSPVLDGLNPPQQAMIATEATLTIGTAITEAQFEAGFPTADPANITPVDFISLLMAAGGMTQAQVNTFESDPNMGWLRLMFTLATDGIPRDNTLTTKGFAALVAANPPYLTAEGSAAVITAWPSAATYKPGSI